MRIGWHRIKQIDSFALVDRSSKVIDSALSKIKFITKKHLDLYNSVFSLYIKVYRGGARRNSCRKVQFYHDFLDKNLTNMQRIKKQTQNSNSAYLICLGWVNNEEILLD